MVRKDDKAFKAVVDKAMTAIYKSGQINAIYSKWFEKPVPPKGINLNLPMSDAVQEGGRQPDRLGRSRGLQVSVSTAGRRRGPVLRPC